MQKINETRVEQPRIYAQLSGIFMEDALAVNVQIYREHDENEWRMELQDDSAYPVVWKNYFITPEQAWDAFIAVVQTEGMESVFGSMKVRFR
ncbi:MAG: hypothetical protein Q8O31_04025 [Rhodocyclaceae bacterium]|nr:hypothetical protein [Rhodocyclaceae bacterium]